MLALLKNPGFRVLGQIKVDEKFSWMMNLLGMSQSTFTRVCDPRIYYLTDILNDDSYGYIDDESQRVVKPFIMDNQMASLTDSDVAIIDSGIYLYLWIGQSVSDDVMSSIFGYENFAQAKHYGLYQIEGQGESVDKLWGIVDQLRQDKGGSYQQLKFML